MLRHVQDLPTHKARRLREKQERSKWRKPEDWLHCKNGGNFVQLELGNDTLLHKCRPLSSCTVHARREEVGQGSKHILATFMVS